MKVLKRLLSYSAKYKYRMLAGVFLSFLVSLFNGASLTGMIPIFDSMGSGNEYKFQITMTKRDRAILLREQEKENFSKLEKIEFFIAKLKQNVNEYFQGLSAYEVVKTFIQIVFPVYILKLLCLAGAVYLIQSSGAKAIRDLRLDLYKKVQNLPLDSIVKEKTGTLMSRLINDVDALGKIISTDLKDGIIDFFYVITHLTLLLALSWKMFLVVFLVFPVVISPITAFSNKIRKATKNQQERLSSLNGHLQEILAGIRVIRAFGMEEYESKKFKATNQELANKTFKGHFYHQVGPSLVELSGAIVAAIFLSFGAYLMTNENFSKGMFLAFFMTLVFLMKPLKQLGVVYNLFQSGISAGMRVFEILDMENDIPEPQNPKPIPSKIKTIELKNLSYKYPSSEKLALNQINLSVEYGDVVAFVGPSGAGKSTLKDILALLIYPTSGEYLVNGIDIREFSIHEFRKKVGVVTQDVFLFNTTIRENICLGKLCKEEEILKALEIANALDFVSSLKNGLDTFIGENGLMLSGGQRQRLSIARVVLRNPEILILDEATSALDSESEKLVQTALEKIFSNRITFIIAHRLSTVQYANKICFMENGEILEIGTHSELLKKNGKYKEMALLGNA